MRITTKRYIFIAVVVQLLIANHCFAGAWTREKGEVWDKVGVNYVTINRFREISVRNYLEYGLTDSISLINSFTYKWLSNHYHSTVYDSQSNVGAWVTTDTTTRANGFGDIDLGLKQKLFRGDYAFLSHGAKVKIPGPYDKNDPVPLGNGEFEIDYRMMYGYSLWRWIPGYVNFDAGYRYRFGGLTDQLVYSAEFGSDIGEKVYGQVRFTGAHNFKNGRNEATNSLNPTATRGETSKRVAQCGGDGGALLGSGTSNSEINSNTREILLSLGYKFTEHWIGELKYGPSLRAMSGAEGTSYAASVVYLFK